jgi:hypothetical protein
MFPIHWIEKFLGGGKTSLAEMLQGTKCYMDKQQAKDPPVKNKMTNKLSGN